MSVSLPEDILGLEEASAELDRLEAADAAAVGTTKGGTPAAKPKESATEVQRAAPAAEAVTPAETVDPAKAKPGAVAPAKVEPGAVAAPAESRYAKAVKRQERSWAELNAEKETLKREREEFDRVKSEHSQARAQAETEFTPQAYEDAAKKFEEAGKFELAELARDKAAELRKNPPATKPAPDNEEPLRKEWALKAGVDFPEVARKNSPLQVRVAQLLHDEPDLKKHPKGIYMAARLADLEQRAAGVPGKDAELVTLRAKVKELEGLTAPGDPASAVAPAGTQTFEQLSDTEQYDQLNREARELGPLR